MTMKFMEEGLRFGRTWVDRIMGKVDKDQGVANAGKVLGIGADGIVTPVEQSGGGGSEPSFEKIEISSNEKIYYNNTVYTASTIKNVPIFIVSRPSYKNPKVTVNSIDENNAIIHISLADGNGSTSIDGNVILSGWATQYSGSDTSINANCTGYIDVNISSNVTLGDSSGSFYIKDYVAVRIDRNDYPSLKYTVNGNTNCFINRPSDSKKFRVIIDNLNDGQIRLSGGATVYSIYAPPNVLSKSPFV